MKARRGPAQNPADFVVRETATSPPALSSASVGPARQLGAFLRVAETGYAICVCNAPAERRRILDSLLPELVDKDIGIFELEFDRTVETIPGRIRVALTTGAFRVLATRFSTVAISLTGAEATITDAERKSAGRPRVLQGLNQQRDWMDQLGRPIIFWVSEWLLGMLPQWAPDFWAGRSVVIEFPTADEDRARAYPEISSGQWAFNSLEEAERKMRIYEDLLRGENDPKARAGFLHNLAMLHHALGHLAEARKLYDQSLAIEKELGNKPGIARTLGQLAILAQDQGNYVEARAGYESVRAMFEELGDKPGIARTLGQLTILAQDQGDYVEARAGYESIRAIFEELGDKSGIAYALHELAILTQDQGDYAKAHELYDQSLAINRELDDRFGIARTLHQLAMLAQDQGEYPEARKLYDQALETFNDLGAKSEQAAVLHQLGLLAQNQGDLAQARKLYDRSLAIEQELGNMVGVAISLSALGGLAEAEKDNRTALKNYLTALTIFEELKSPSRDTAKKDIARMRQRLGDGAFKKLHDEVVAELKQPTAHS
ncbi:MAG: tetratricopeptide repeat protein [candidate division WOR-3 bacterium]|nr:tetratricopeptide repeat protein [candidate division WOR-3 bacterium]